MVGEFDSGTPTLQVNVYEDGALAVTHGPTDVLAPEPEDLGSPSEGLAS